ncbi:hypothetical protein ACW9HR_22155 [Nocardia gipuzkoensis]
MHRLATLARRALTALRDAALASRRPAQVRVRVYLNTDPTALLTGYRPAPVTLAYTYLLRVDPAADTDQALLERVFAAFNDHPAHDDDQIHTDTWYGKRLRSLSVGDLVGLDDRHYTCQSRGWTRVPAPPG